MNQKKCGIVAAILILGIFCNVGSSFAASDADNDTGYSRRQILKMGLDRFTEIYCSQPQHRKHPQESAAGLYRRYKQPDNQRHIARLSEKHKRQVKPLYAALENWEDTAWMLRLYNSGGGTAWIADSIMSAGELEELLGQVIGCYEQSQHLPARHSLAPAQVTQGSSLLLKRCENLLAKDEVARTDDFRKTLTMFRQQTATLKEALLFQSPSVQRVVAKHLSKFAQTVLL